jgi:inorganic pyrophosphatase
MSNAIHALPTGKNAPHEVYAVIEIPKGSHNKYEFDEENNVFVLDRVLYSPMHYPLDYGFIPATRSEDGDHLDIIVIGTDPLPQGCVVVARPVAMLEMVDDGEKDYKILAVQVKNPRLTHLKDVDDVRAWNSHMLDEVKHFMESYKHLEGKKAVVAGWHDAEAARKEITEAQAAYQSESK